ncbi:MAG: hypothetical protein J6A28_00545 [Clostridia bacterium]|nr:hypothetical protein [Clostridia bacterium]
MDREKIKGYLNISRKAGYLIIGGETLEDYKKKLFLVLFDNSAGLSTLKIVDKIKARGIHVVGIESLGDLCAIPTCKIVGIKNKNISEIIESLINE